MALLHLITIAVLCAVAAVSRADDAPGRAVEVRFVPATPGGTVSLGIYDTQDRPVRVLCDEWTFNRFRVGLDGLSVKWDGLDDDGRPVPPGTYAARGFTVGNVGMSGEAFHFNDWIDAPESPRIVTVAAQQLLPDGDVLLAARLAGAAGALVRFSPQSDVRWNTVVRRPRPEPARSAQLAVSDTMAFVLLDGQLGAVRLEDGAEVALPMKTGGVRAVAARGSRLVVLDGAGLSFYSLPDFAPAGSADGAPAGLVSVALTESGVVGCADDGSVWIHGTSWSRLEIPGNVRVREVSNGHGGTFWVLQEADGGVLSVAQYSPEEGRLAEWIPAASDGRLASVSGSAWNDFFVASLVSPGAQRTVAIRRKDDGAGWAFVFDKKITACADFGWKDGRLEAASGERPAELTVDVDENPLDPSAPRRLVLRATADKDGAGLSTADGLPLVRVADGGGGRVMVVAGTEAGSARFFLGDGACVEEYALKNLGDIASFDAGVINMGKTGENPPPPAEEPVEMDPLESTGGSSP